MWSVKEGVLMTDITLHTKSKSTVTCVSNTFIDEYMADANGEFVKIIYIYSAASTQLRIFPFLKWLINLTIQKRILNVP
jgi:hypothetical protein